MKVTFQIEGGSPVIIECNAGDNLLELARRANVAIDAPCSGNGSCGKCRVKLIEGELGPLRAAISPTRNMKPAGGLAATARLWVTAPCLCRILPALTSPA